MREHPNTHYDKLGYKRRVEAEYFEFGDVTFIKEYVYNPEEEDEIEREIEHFDVCMYPGKPDMKTTKARYSTVKRLLWEEPIEGVEYIDWVPIGARRDRIGEEAEAFIATLQLPEIDHTKPLTAMEAVKRHSYEDPLRLIKSRRERESYKMVEESNSEDDWFDEGDLLDPIFDCDLPCVDEDMLDNL